MIYEQSKAKLKVLCKNDITPDMKVVKIGRYIDNDVVINDRTVERNHIQITRHDDGHYTLLDLQSSNGTFVNGKRVVGEVELHYDEVIKIGNTTLRWEDYFPDDEREKLRRELEALKKESCPPPPPDNAMCYCRPPRDWHDSEDDKDDDKSGDDTSNDGSGNSIPVWKIILLIEGAILLGILLYCYLFK